MTLNRYPTRYGIGRKALLALAGCSMLAGCQVGSMPLLPDRGKSAAAPSGATQQIAARPATSPAMTITEAPTPKPKPAAKPQSQVIIVESGEDTIPPAPYTTTPGYQSAYAQYWPEVEDQRPAREKTVSKGRDVLAVRDEPSSGGVADLEPEIPVAPVLESSPQRLPQQTSQPEAAEQDTGQAWATIRQQPADLEPAPQPELMPAPAREPVQQNQPPAIPRSGNYAIHLASYRLKENADKGWDILLARHAGVLSVLYPVVSEDDIPGLGLHYRLKAGPFASEDEALESCRRIEAAGDYCAVMGFSGDPL